ELLKAHPFPPAKTALKNLVGTMYKGEWKTLPDFSTLKPALMEDFNTGVIDVAQSGQKDAFAMVWTAQFDAPADGKYNFTFDCDDFGALYVGGERIAEIQGHRPRRQARQGSARHPEEGAQPDPCRIRRIRR
ncbi:MAG: hypothetical protein EBR95_10120, partial [Verrucomicrobia bacterium]|nr:hypothetical protein [Verrucomicrobiota bacterium]